MGHPKEEIHRRRIRDTPVAMIVRYGKLELSI